jgi:O-antigen/teichoic acid export membrane protein
VVETRAPGEAHPLRGAETTGAGVAVTTLGGLGLHVLLKLRGLVLLPLYARLLDPHGLGLVQLGSALATFVVPLLHLGVPTGTLVELPHLAGREAVARAYRTVVALVAGATLVACLGLPWLLATLPLPSLAELAPHGAAISLMVAGMALRELGQVVPQLRREMRYLTLLGVAMEYGSAVVGILLVLRGGGAAGLLWGTGLVTTAGALLSIGRSLRDCGPVKGFDLAFARSALALGVPLFAITTAQWFVQSADRFFLVHYEGAAAVGVYGLGAAIASAVLALSAALSTVFLPIAVSLLGSPARLLKYVEECVRLTVLALGLCVAGAWVIGRPTLRVLAGPSYVAAGDVLPMMTVAYALFTLVQLLQWVPMSVARSVRGVAWTQGAMAAMNLALDAVLIPRFGMEGAAAAAIVAYAVGVGLTAGLARGALPEWRWTAALPSLTFATAAGLAASWVRLPAEAGLLALAASSAAVCAVYLGAALVCGVVRRSDITLLVGAIGSAAARLRRR